MEIKKDSVIIIALIVFSLVLSILQTVQINGLKNKITANAVGNGDIDASKWTEDEKMMYEHHGVLPSKLQNTPQNQNVPSMVGGC